MLITNKKNFMKGLLLMGSFAVVFFIIMSPVFKTDAGEPQNGLSYADDLFNKLSKGSSYFIKEVQAGVDKNAGKTIELAYAMKKAEKAEAFAKIATAAGATASVSGTNITIKGDLATLLTATVKDSDALYHNDSKAIADRYGMDHMVAMEAWWEGLSPMIKALQKNKQIPEAQVVDLVLKKAVEPGYNFFGIPAAQVSEKAGVMIALLVFYVIYTMWYGYAIFDLFDGIGLTMSKSKVKKEA